MGYVALSAFLASPIAEPEDIPEGEKTPEYWAERLGREWCGLPSNVLAEKLLPFFREFNRLCEGEKGNLVQATSVPADPQCDQLHAQEAWVAAERIMAEFKDDPDEVSVNYVAAVFYDLLRKATRESEARIHALETALAELIYDATCLAPREDRPGFDEQVRRPIIKQSKIDAARSVLSEKQS